MISLLREPLVHFLVLGAAIFALYAVFDDSPAPVPANRVEVLESDAARLATQFEATWRRAPTGDELEALVDNFVKEEVLVREARTFGLDRGDAVVRQRLAQKMTFLLEGVAEPAPPTDTELEAHYDAYPERFRTAPQVAFEQIMLRGLDADATLSALNAGADPATLGRASLLPIAIDLAPRVSIDATFGRGFFEAVTALPKGTWAGPVQSGYGPHLVRVRQIEPGTLPPLEEIREDVARDWRDTVRDVRQQEALAALIARYDVALPDSDATQ